MKKVVSALTAAAMCASMAGIASVFAYTTDEVTYYLGVTSEGAGYTVSEDGKTITFASAADAAGAKFTVGHFIDADTSKPAVQQIGAMVEGSSPLVHLTAGSATQLTEDTGKAVDVTGSNGNSATGVTQKLNAFGFVDFLGMYYPSCGSLAWGHSSTWPADWYTGENERLTWVWAYGFDQIDYDNYKDTAHFLGTNSDDYSLVDFEVTLDSAIVDGTYTIDWVETSKNNFDDKAQATFLNAGDSVLMPIATKDALTIVVGSGDVQETDPTTEPTTAPTTAPTTEPTTEGSGSDDTTGNADPGKYAWDIEDNVVPEDKNGNKIAYIDLYVWNDEGTNGYTVDIDIEGKEFSDFGMNLRSITKGNAYDRITDFVTNVEEGSAAGSNTTEDQSTMIAANGATVMTYMVLIPATVEDGVYELTFDVENTKIGGDGVEMKPTFLSGSLVIGDVEVETTEPTEDPTSDQPTEDPTTEPTDEPTTKPTEPTQDGDYLYGDVNKNGKVELVDIVMLNRKLTGYGDQQLDDYQTEVADCWDDGALDGKDSTTILQYLIGLVASLPVAAK